MVMFFGVVVFFCGGVVCGDVFCGDVFCGGVFVVVFFLWWCSCAGVFVVM